MSFYLKCFKTLCCIKDRELFVYLRIEFAREESHEQTTYVTSSKCYHLWQISADCHYASHQISHNYSSTCLPHRQIYRKNGVLNHVVGYNGCENKWPVAQHPHWRHDIHKLLQNFLDERRSTWNDVTSTLAAWEKSDNHGNKTRFLRCWHVWDLRATVRVSESGKERKKKSDKLCLSNSQSKPLIWLYRDRCKNKR